jgi:biotin operon repressor
MLKPQDVALLIKILAQRTEGDWRQVDLAMDLCLSQGEVAKALARLKKAGLVIDKRVNRTAALEFILHAVKYVFPIELGPMAVGVPTAISAPMHKGYVVNDADDVYVWPMLNGTIRGQIIVPLYSKLAEASLRDTEFYEMMSAIEILRMGRVRERKAAEQFLERKFKV